MNDNDFHDAIIVADSIEKRFDGVIALAGATVSLRRGAICGLLGANGSGKSTFSKVLCGIHEPNGGTVSIDGEQVHIQSPHHALEYGIAMVHQHLSLIPDLTVWQNITLGHERTTRYGRIDERACREQATEALAAFSESVEIDSVVADLSSAHRQIVEIAKALVLKPQILILDEPTASLEMGEVTDLFRAMQRLKENGVSMIFTSHRMWEVMEICEYAVVFRNGRDVGVVESLDDPDAEQTIVSLIVGAEESKESAPSIASAGAANDRPSKAYDNESPVIELRDVRVPRGRKVAGEELSLKVFPGEIVGISGIHGQGQEELLLCMAGHLPFISGTSLIDGTAISLHGTKKAVANGIALVPGDRNEEGLFLHHDLSVNGGFPSIVNGDYGLFVKNKDRLVHAQRIIDSMSIVPADPRKPARHFSGGNAQKIVVGKWYVRNPRLLLLSDPAKGVDVGAKHELYKAVRDLAHKGAGVVVYASDNRELADVCDRVYIMFEGGVVAEVQRRDLSDDLITELSLRSGRTGRENGVRSEV